MGKDTITMEGRQVGQIVTDEELFGKQNNIVTDEEIEARIRSMESTEIDSKIIGELVMKKLKSVDKVAYIRFASVYRSFDDIKEFEQELKILKK